MHQIIAGILAALLAAGQAGAAADALPEPERVTVLGELQKLPDQDWIGLTNAQMAEDLEYLYQALDENYPYFEVGKRMSGGTGLRDSYPQIRKKVQACESDVDFFVLLDTWLRKDGASAGHLGVLLPGSPEAYGEVYHEMSPGSPYDEAYNSDKVKKSYEGFGKLFNPVWDRVMAYYGEDTGEQNLPNVETKILEKGKIAYVNIRSFDMMQYDSDGKVLRDFYREVADYDHLIIDISQNGGGGMAYFEDLIMEPNLDHEVSWSFYSLFKNGPLNQKFASTGEIVENGWHEPASRFPQFDGFHREDLQDVDYFWKTTMTMTENDLPPDGALFKGRIWMLVSGNVYSSSEWAAMVSKATGFATLVGTQTGGDGIGVDPVPVVLPNSGLIVRYSPIYGVTQEGLGSEEKGTTPDIISPEGETPLETCLRAIHEAK